MLQALCYTTACCCCCCSCNQQSGTRAILQECSLDVATAVVANIGIALCARQPTVILTLHLAFGGLQFFIVVADGVHVLFDRWRFKTIQSRAMNRRALYHSAFSQDALLIKAPPSTSQVLFHSFCSQLSLQANPAIDVALCLPLVLHQSVPLPG